MKTPREILLRSHDDADAKLDALRRATVAQLNSPPAPRRESRPRYFALTIWQELILPARRIWAGLAATWILLLIVNTQISTNPRATASAQNNAPTELWQKYQEEKQLLTELAGMAESKIVTPAMPFAPRPRSERQSRWKVA
jgi:hypothetical protein